MQKTDRSLSQPEFVLLCLFAIALPLVEAPKNVFWALFLLVWLASSIRQNNFGQLVGAWDLVFAGLIVAPVISIAATAYTPQWKEVGDICGYVSLAWILARSRLEMRQLYILLTCLVGASFVGVLHGYWVLVTDAKRIWLQLNSVGHVNHSALYGAGVAVMAAALAAVICRVCSMRWKVLSLFSAVSMLGVMIAFASRGALVAYLFGLLLVLLTLSGLRLRHLLALGGLALVLAVGVQWLTQELTGAKNNQTLIQKTIDGVASGKISSYRIEAFNTAFEMLRAYPLTGTGAANFSAVSPEQLQGWVEARGEVFERNDYLFSSHAHGLYANTLGERGLLGIVALGALLIGWSVALWHRRPKLEASTLARLSWGAGVAGWSVVFIGGLFNTTLHHEHGMLGMVCLGLLLSGAPLRVKAAA